MEAATAVRDNEPPEEDRCPPRTYKKFKSRRRQRRLGTPRVSDAGLRSPWILGAPQRGLARLISRISRRILISSGTLGLPLRDCDFQRQNKRKPARCERTTVL